MKKILIVLISVNFMNSRKACERSENNYYKTEEEAIKDIKKELGEESKNDTDILTFDLSDFMDAANNQEMDNLSEYFMCYVNITT